jgi:hypothetical protein
MTSRTAWEATQTSRLIKSACPGSEECVGTNYRHRCWMSKWPARRVLNQAANAAVKAKGTIFAIVYRRLLPP